MAQVRVARLSYVYYGALLWKFNFYRPIKWHSPKSCLQPELTSANEQVPTSASVRFYLGLGIKSGIILVMLRLCSSGYCRFQDLIRTVLS